MLHTARAMHHVGSGNYATHCPCDAPRWVRQCATSYCPCDAPRWVRQCVTYCTCYILPLRCTTFDQAMCYILHVRYNTSDKRRPTLEATRLVMVSVGPYWRQQFTCPTKHALKYSLSLVRVHTKSATCRSVGAILCILQPGLTSVALLDKG
ncbi:hypothetical protein PoB_006909100 [Plakobranchus ocellatus]|uniref:Uncharacterized protein n=1 Tax=Plakobranchus ocellatus TaxID=259542 RepID=A0AAV4DFJ3_9GAST|nr:hypothetical protein PoB_006909100 [Plakobranchus ocellatus]